MTPNNVYLVGGAVRDGLLGLPVHDKDFVVVGSTAAIMESLGFRPVGKDFPVFLHPQTQDEYALARTERKSGQGYKGFTVHADQSVTLEQDLGRRDLTINAMAQSQSGQIIDPYGGRSDLKEGILRHVSPEAFMEDPVRILRLARFAARYDNFVIAQDTLDLVKKMVKQGEVDHLVSERVWQELSKGLMEKAPQRMFEVLRETGALKILMPELDALWGIPQTEKYHPEVDTGVHVMMVLEQAAKVKAPLEVRYATIMHDLGKGVTPQEQWPAHHAHENLGAPLVSQVCDRLKVSAECRSLALMVCKEHTHVHRCADLKHSTIVSLFERTDAFRRPARFEQFLQACECDSRGRLGLEERNYPQRAYLKEALEMVRALNIASVVAACSSPADIPNRIHGERVRALKNLSKDAVLETASPAQNTAKVRP